MGLDFVCVICTELIRFYVEHVSAMQVAYVDAYEAYDRVNIHKQLTKLQQLQAPNYILRLRSSDHDIQANIMMCYATTNMIRQHLYCCSSDVKKHDLYSLAFFSNVFSCLYKCIHHHH